MSTDAVGQSELLPIFTESDHPSIIGSTMIIDIHTHIVPESFPPAPRKRIAQLWPSMVPNDTFSSTLMIGSQEVRSLNSQCWRLSQRIEDAKNDGIDKQVLSPMPRLCDYRLPARDGLTLAQYVNESVAEMVHQDSQHFIGLGTVPLQDPWVAASELSNVQRLGLRGVEITTNIGGKSPGHPRFEPFWAEAERLGLSVFVHAQEPTFSDRLVGPDYLENAVGFPIENTLACASIITGGILDRFPGLRIAFSHGGGGLLFQLARLQILWTRNSALQEAMKLSPTEAARMLFYDDMVFEPRILEFIIGTVGVEQVVIGSDYPLMARAQTPSEMLGALGLPDDQVEMIEWRNALRFLGMTEEQAL